MTFEQLKVERVADYGSTIHYRCQAGKDGGPMVTVRIGRFNVYACLTCLKTDCIHANAVRGFAAEERAADLVEAAR